MNNLERGAMQDLVKGSQWLLDMSADDVRPTQDQIIFVQIAILQGRRELLADERNEHGEDGKYIPE